MYQGFLTSLACSARQFEIQQPGQLLAHVCAGLGKKSDSAFLVSSVLSHLTSHFWVPFGHITALIGISTKALEPYKLLHYWLDKSDLSAAKIGFS